MRLIIQRHAIKWLSWLRSRVVLLVRIVGSLILLSVLGCQNISTQALLDSELPGTDTTPPLLLAPAKNGRVIGLSADLSWSPRNGAGKYIIDVSTTADYAKPISGSPFSTPETFLKISLPETSVYYWRVKAPSTKGAPNTSYFDALTDAVYVYCPENTTCSDTDRGGSKTNPYQSIGAALGAAKTLGIPVRVAARGSSGQGYVEAVSLVDGVNMYGGYDTSFTESARNATTNVTTITSGAIPVTASYITKATIVDGFKIAGTTNFGVYIDQSSANLLIRNSVISAGDVSSGNSNAIFCVSSTATISGNTITGGGAGGSGASYGIFNQASSPTITSNLIIGGTTVSADSYGMQNSLGSSPKIINNTILGGNSASGNSVAISISENGASIASSPWIINNVISTTDTTGNRFGIREWPGAGTNANPTFLQNNLFFGFTFMYRDINGGGDNNAINTAGSTVTPGIASGNVTITGGQNPFVNSTVNNYKLQNNGAPMTAQEWLDIAYGGLNASGATFGTVVTDRDNASRTAVAGGAINAGASGYSIGAYEF